MELKVAKARMELTKAMKEVVKAIERYKASEDFIVEKARAMVVFYKSEDFFANCRAFSQEAYEEGFRMGELECRNEILNHFQGIDLSFLDEEEEPKPINAATKAPSAKLIDIDLAPTFGLLQPIP